MGNIYHFNRLCRVVNEDCVFSHIIQMKLLQQQWNVWELEN